MSEAHKGRSAWNKGIPASEETKAKLKLDNMNEAKTDAAQTVLDDLRLQSKEATERHYLLLGAVQGAEMVFAAFKETEKPVEVLAVEQNARKAKVSKGGN